MVTMMAALSLITLMVFDGCNVFMDDALLVLRLIWLMRMIVVHSNERTIPRTYGIVNNAH